MQPFSALWLGVGLNLAAALVDNPKAAPSVKVAEVDAMGDVSSDGRYLTFVDWSTGDLAIRNLATRADRHLTKKGSWDVMEWAEYSVISPNGKSVAYAWRREDGLYELRIVGIDGSPPKTLVGRGHTYVAPRDWSADGRYILAWFVEPSGDRKIVAVRPEDASITILKTLRQPQGGLLRFSADAKFVAYDRPADPKTGEHDVHVLSVSDGTEEPLAATLADERLIAWRKGGTVFFTRRRDGQFSLDSILVDVQPGVGLNKGEPRRILDRFDQVDRPLTESLGFTDGGDYFFGTVNWVNDLYLTTLDLKAGTLRQGEQIASRVSIAGSAGWSPGGRSLAWVAGVNSVFQPTQLVVRTMESRRESRRPLVIRELHGFQPHWASDKEVAILGRDSDLRSMLFRVDCRTGEIKNSSAVGTICFDECAAWRWVNCIGPPVLWSTNGELIEVRKPGVSGRDVRHRVAASGAASRLQLSPDGNWLAYVVVDGKTTRVYALPTDAGDPRLLQELDGISEAYNQGGTRIAWLADSSGLLVTRSMGMSGVPIEIWHVPLGETAPRRLEHFIKHPSLFGLSVHPNGRTIALTTGRPRRDEIWRIHGLENSITQPR